MSYESLVTALNSLQRQRTNTFILKFIGGVMSSHRRKNSGSEIGVELKYCEHCGGLWVRERGAGAVYCEKCQPKVEDLAISRKRGRGAQLPAGPQAAVEEYRVEELDEDLAFEAMGGVAWAR